MTEEAPVVSLREITPQNFDAIINLRVREDQKRFVASNQFSLAEARVFPGRFPLAVYAGETPVGFVMYVDWQERSQFWIFRLMIDASQQGRGYGRAAMRLLIERMRAIPGCRQIYISYDPENHAARSLYTSLGFVITGDVEGGEEVALLTLPREM